MNIAWEKLSLPPPPLQPTMTLRALTICQNWPARPFPDQSVCK